METYMATYDADIFETTVDEALTVLHEDFSTLLFDCCDQQEVLIRIRDEIKRQQPDFLKVVALGLVGEVIRGK
jgi:hypothetical protein